MSVDTNLAKQMAKSVSTSTPQAEKSDIQIILQLARSNGGNVSPVDCMIATGKPFAEVMKTLESLWDDGWLEIGNHQDSEIIYKLV